MKKVFFNMGLILTIGTGLGACGVDDSGDNDDPAEETKENVLALINGVNLMGEWQGECSDAVLLDKSARIEYEFSGDDVEKTYRIYEESDCKDKLAIVSYAGETNIERVKGRDTYRKLDLKYKKVKVILDNENAAKLFSAANFCGIKEWKADKQYDLTKESRKAGCPLPEAPTTDHELVKIEDERLYFGNPGLGFAADEDARPKEVDKDQKYKKKD